MRYSTACDDVACDVHSVYIMYSIALDIIPRHDAARDADVHYTLCSDIDAVHTDDGYHLMTGTFLT